MQFDLFYYYSSFAHSRLCCFRVQGIREVGVIAQEVKEVVGSAVVEGGDVVLVDGSTVTSLHRVVKDSLYMTNIAATIELHNKLVCAGFIGPFLISWHIHFAFLYC